MILLDTDVMIDLLRQYPPAVTWLNSLGAEEIILPGFVAMELIQGCGDKAEQQELERELRAYGVVWPSPPVCNEALSVFASYYLSHGLGILDALIGQMAVSLNVNLCTFNQKHYSVIPDLNTLQPYKKIP
jgi:predicted nucleic acid-binding protein